MRRARDLEVTRPRHGADIVATARRHGIAPECLLDFSSNVNPYGPPPGARRWLARAVQDWALLRGYPDDGHSELRSAVARRWRVPSEAVVVGNGTSALLHEVVRLFTPRSYLLPEPAFSEYAHALRSVGARRIAFPLQAEKGFRLDPDAFAHALLRSHPSLAIVTNPHNPSGALTSGHGIDAIVEAGRRAGTLLLLDEAFIDYAGAGATRVVAAAAGAHLVVLRSLTKLYGMAGLRVGAAVSAPELAAPLRAALASWPVGALAAGAALEAVRDTGFAAQARERNARDRRLLARGLGCLGCRVFPSAANFLLLRLPEGSSSAGLLRERLVANHGILVRDASSYSGLEAGRFLRVAVRRRAENRRLLTALRRLLGEAPRC